MTKTQEQLITTSTGHQYMATYAGRLGDAQYFVCKKVGGDTIVGTVATLDGQKFGPLCNGYMNAALRARNVADTRKSWFAQLFLHQK